MIINTSLEIADSQIITKLKERFASIPTANWNFAPPDLAFRFAADKFGDTILPLYNVFRIGAPQNADERYNIGGFTLPYRVGRDTTLNVFKSFIKYQVDFYTNSLYDINQSVMDFYRFKKQRELTFSFDDFGLPGETYPSQVFFEDPEDASGIDDDKLYSEGRYFRYTYVITLDFPLFDINKEVVAESIVIDMYEHRVSAKTFMGRVEIK